MNKPGLGGGMKRGSGLGRRLDFLPSSSFSPSVPPFWRGKDHFFKKGILSHVFVHCVTSGFLTVNTHKQINMHAHTFGFLCLSCKIL